jgi:hypothetical protein
MAKKKKRKAPGIFSKRFWKIPKKKKSSRSRRQKTPRINPNDYSSLIVGPKATDYASINNEVNEYEKALAGNPSKQVLSVLPPFGRIYFQYTGETCTGPNGRKYPQHTVVDAHRSKMSIFDSANRDFNNAQTINMPSRKVISADRCVPVTIKTIDSGGKAGKDTKYVAVYEAKNISPDIKMRKNKKETMMNLMDSGEVDFDAGQQLFVGSVTVLGLYMLFRMLYKKQ